MLQGGLIVGLDSTPKPLTNLVPLDILVDYFLGWAVLDGMANSNTYSTLLLVDLA